MAPRFRTTTWYWPICVASSATAMIWPSTLVVGACGVKVSERVAFLRNQPVAFERFARAFGEHRLGHFAGPVHHGGGHVRSLVADDVARTDVVDRFADVHDRVALVELTVQAFHVDLVSRAADHVVVAEREDVRRIQGLLLGEHAGLGQERGDRRERNGVDGAVERFAAQAGLQARAAVLRNADVGIAIGAIRQRQHVTRIDEVWVLDLRD